MGEKTVTEIQAPVPIAVVGAGTGLVPGTVANTPHDQPNVIITVVQPFVAILVRFAM